MFNSTTKSESNNLLIRNLPYLQWQDYRAIADNTHPLWMSSDNKSTLLFAELSQALRMYYTKTCQALADELIRSNALLFRPESDWRSVSKASLEFNCEVQRDASQSYALLGPLGYSEYVEGDGVTSHVLLGWEINVLSRNWLSRLDQQDESFFDTHGAIINSRRGQFSLNYTAIPDVTLYLGSFLLGGSHWMEAIEKIYQHVYCSGPIQRKWRELG